MKFRQRIAWLLVAVYLACTFAFIYYVFEINDHYNSFALDHVQKFHTPDLNKNSEKSLPKPSIFSTVWSHVTDLPMPFWVILFLLPYLQLFMMILACTRAEPKMSVAYLWPGLLYLKYQQVFNKQPGNSIIPLEAHKLTKNGFTVIHT